MGTGDLSVGREVRRMAEAFYGGSPLTSRAWRGDEAMLQPALARNLFGTVTPSDAQLAAVADYVRREAAGLERQDAAALLAGDIAFGPPVETGRPAAAAMTEA